MKVISSTVEDANVNADASQKISTLVIPENLTKVFFLKLELQDASGKQISSNFYWLSSNGDATADFTDLDKLPKSDIQVSTSALQLDGNKYKLSVTLENPGATLAFAINPKILNAKSGDPVLPVFWEDNYISLLPKEKRTVQVEFDMKNLAGEKPLLKVDGWNVNAVMKEIK
jgi:exo-1,4-beta-D-glucosaminidase